MAESTAAENNSLKYLQEFAVEASAVSARITEELGAAQDPAVIARHVQDLGSLVSDLAQATLAAHNEHYDWQDDAAQEIEDIKDALGAESVLSLEDAERLKSTLIDLMNNLRAPLGEKDEALEALKARGVEAVAFIDSIAEEEDPDEDEDES